MLRDLIPDALALVGLASVVTGVALEFGSTWALMVAGLVLVATGVALARRR